MPQLPKRTLGKGAHALEVGAIGLGCMGMTAFYSGSNPVPKEECIKVIETAIDHGCNFLDTAELYNVGKTVDNNEQIVGEGIKRAARESVVIGAKVGVYIQNGGMVMDRSPQHMREAIANSLRYLGVDYIDLCYINRKDSKTPIEETMRALKELVEEGKIKHIGLSEVSAREVRTAHAIHPITAYQLEWSLWSRDAEDEIIPLCRELGIGIVAYSPLGRGFLTGAIKSPGDLDEKDYRRVGQPRFAEEAFQKNLELVERMRQLAERKGCTASQLALAWVLAQGDDVVPIPGTRREKYLLENLGAVDVKLSADDLKELEEAFPHDQVVGDRYADMHHTFHSGDAQTK